MVQLINCLARLLAGFTVLTVVVNVVILAPKISFVGENHYFFSEENHMHRSSRHHLAGNATRSQQARGNKPGSVKSTPSLLPDKDNPHQIPRLSFSEEEGRQYILDIFQEAGVSLTPEMESQLPTWQQVRDVVGDHPHILNLECCPAFREKVPPLERMLGASGMFNTGTNLVTHLLKQNCEIPERREKYGPHQSKESYGMRWQVPWGKHTPVKFRKDHSTKKASAINKEYILPIVTIRHPYSWFKSMCKNGYTAQWDHHKTGKDGLTRGCPNLKTGSQSVWNPVTVKYADNRDDHHLSLAHLWNDWYSYYLDQADFPFLVIRMEDLVFYPKETTKIVCECAGGKIRTDQENFSFVVDSAKADSPGHDKSTGIFAAWVKYSRPPPPRFGFSQSDYTAAKEALNDRLMGLMGYKHPPDIPNV
ncbi:hypothetical protein IV203_013347 [Nitzschia inconspicua]|uniref:Sulfotransferase n=1 Tax=Nitzschia inconspicua TaxID=303405 RepID=A0A9K3M564_9STRA|nr:hypothetical protein IV203_013347 [Nitzschia inconspicua]